MPHLPRGERILGQVRQGRGRAIIPVRQPLDAEGDIDAIAGAAGIVVALWLGASAVRDGARFEPDVWRLWGRVGAALSLVFYLIEYTPSHLAMRLEVNHPFYALAWWGGAEIVGAAGAWALDRSRFERRRLAGRVDRPHQCRGHRQAGRVGCRLSAVSANVDHHRHACVRAELGRLHAYATGETRRRSRAGARTARNGRGGSGCSAGSPAVAPR